MKRWISILLAFVLMLSPLTGALAQGMSLTIEVIAGSSKEFVLSTVGSSDGSSPLIELGEVTSSNTNVATGEMVILQKGNQYDVAVRASGHQAGHAMLEGAWSTFGFPRTGVVAVNVKDDTPASLPLEITLESMPSQIRLETSDLGWDALDEFKWKAAEVTVVAGAAAMAASSAGATTVGAAAGGAALSTLGVASASLPPVAAVVGAVTVATITMELAGIGLEALGAAHKTVVTNPDPVKLKLSIHNPNPFEVKNARIEICSDNRYLNLYTLLTGTKYVNKLPAIKAFDTITHTVKILPSVVYDRGAYTDTLSISAWYIDEDGKQQTKSVKTSPIQVVSYLGSKEEYDGTLRKPAPAKNVSIHCPVDVHILDAAGTLIGTLSKDGDAVQAEGIGGYVAGESKLLSIAADKLDAYTLQLEATDDGFMMVNAMDNKADGSVGVTQFNEVSLHKGEVLTTDITDTDITRLYAADGTEIEPDYVLNRETLMRTLEEETDVSAEKREAVCDAILLGLVREDFLPPYQMDYGSVSTYLSMCTELSPESIENASYSVLLALMYEEIDPIAASSDAVAAQFAKYSPLSAADAEAVRSAVCAGLASGTLTADAVMDRSTLTAYLAEQGVSTEAAETACNAIEMNLVRVGAASEEDDELVLLADSEQFKVCTFGYKTLSQQQMQTVCFAAQIGLLTGALAPDCLLDRTAMTEFMGRYWEIPAEDVEIACDVILLGLLGGKIKITQSFQQAVQLEEFLSAVIGLAELYMGEARGATLAAAMGEERAGEPYPKGFVIDTAVAIGMLPENPWAELAERAELAYGAGELNGQSGAWALLGCLDMLTGTEHLAQVASDEDAVSIAAELGLLDFGRDPQPWQYSQPFSYEQAAEALLMLWRALEAQ